MRLAVPPEFLPAPDDLPDQPYLLPELAYPRRLNAATELIGGALAAGFGERAALHCEDHTVTYAELADAVTRLGSGLVALGISPGDRVLLRLADGPDLVCWILALQRIGAIPVPTFTLSRAADLVYRENDTEAVAVVAGAELLAEVDAARPGFRYAQHLVAVPATADPAYLDAETVVASGSGGLGALPEDPTDRDDVALILYTSGSTGRPKGCWHTHADVLAICDSYARYCLRPTPDDVFAGPPPIPFALGFGFFVVFPLRFGASAVLTTRKRPADMLRDVERFGVTVLTGVATYFGMLLEEVTGARPATGSLRCCCAEGSRCRRASRTGVPRRSDCRSRSSSARPSCCTTS
jgi:2-aminobenzoate-CoA ligase